MLGWSSAFEVSLSHLIFGIKFLGSNHRREEYELSLALYNAAAQMMSITGQLDGLSNTSKKFLQITGG